jgi:hypothetical protein
MTMNKSELAWQELCREVPRLTEEAYTYYPKLRPEEEIDTVYKPTAEDWDRMWDEIDAASAAEDARKLAEIEEREETAVILTIDEFDLDLGAIWDAEGKGVVYHTDPALSGEDEWAQTDAERESAQRYWDTLHERPGYEFDDEDDYTSGLIEIGE